MPWRRMMAEGVVIVSSILLALATDAWWDGHRDREREAQFLLSLTQELSANRDRLLRTDSTHSRHVRASGAFFEMSPADLGRLTPDSAAALWTSINTVITISLREEVITRDEVSLVRDPDLRNAIGEWTALTSDVNEDAPYIVTSAREAGRRAFEISPDILRFGVLDGSSALALQALREDRTYSGFLLELSGTIGIDREKIRALTAHTNVLLGLLRAD